MQVVSPSKTADRRYVFDNAGQETGDRFTGLQQVFDPGTMRHLGERGVAPGWHCLEVGAGSGTIPRWLADRVGAGGHVLATDIDTHFLDGLRLPNLEVRRHDITADPLPDEAFDLIHARLVLCHLPARDAVLARMAAALRPGGWLVIEDFDSFSVAPDPALDPAEGELKIWSAMHDLFAQQGLDEMYGRRVAGRMNRLGLVEIGAEGRVFRWQGGSAGAHFLLASAHQLREPLVATGRISEAELEAELARLDDLAFAHPSPVMWATWGRRPRAA